jgi:hypothetical protein
MFFDRDTAHPNAPQRLDELRRTLVLLVAVAEGPYFLVVGVVGVAESLAVNQPHEKTSPALPMAKQQSAWACTRRTRTPSNPSTIIGRGSKSSSSTAYGF